MRTERGLINLRCDYCRSSLYSASDVEGLRYLGEAEGFQCPACQAPLWDATLMNVPVRACKQCGGMLVAMGAFEGLIEQVRAQHEGKEIPVTEDAGGLGRKLNCPICHRAMDTHFYYGGGHVVIEDCERCELNWLEGGALQRIAYAPRASALER
jgi:Zn-finger nucleic acid-binding protein